MKVPLKTCPICNKQITIDYSDARNVRYMCPTKNKYNDSHYIIGGDISYRMRMIAGEYLIIKDLNSEIFYIYDYEQMRHLDTGGRKCLLELKSLDIDKIQTWPHKIKLLLPFS